MYHQTVTFKKDLCQNLTMRYTDYIDFRGIIVQELNEATKLEGRLAEIHPGLPVTRGEYVATAINHLREAVEVLPDNAARKSVYAEIRELEEAYEKLADRDRSLVRGILANLKTDFLAARNLLSKAENQYSFFRKKTAEGYPHEQLILETLFRMQIAAERLGSTKVAPKIRLNIEAIEQGVREVWVRDIEFLKQVNHPN